MRLKLNIIVIFLLLGTYVGQAWSADPVSQFRAGASAVDITPQDFPRIVAGGFLEGRAESAADKLWVRSIALDDGSDPLVLTVVDTCMMTQTLIDEAKRLASEKCGVASERMMVSATHTHSAPAAMGCLGTRLDEDYAAWLPAKIASAIVQAFDSLQAAKIGWTSIDDWEHTHNRRWIRKPEAMVVDPFGQANGRAHMHPGYQSADVIGPSGPVDPTLSLVAVQTVKGTPLAVLANYSQHYFGAAPLSADYYGLFCKHIAEHLGQSGEGNGPFVAALSQGTSGDLMWMDYGSPQKSLSMAEYAAAVAQYAERGLSQIVYHDWVPLGIVEKRLRLNYRVPSAERLAWAKPIASLIENGLPKNIPEVYAQEAIILDQRQSTELKLQAIRIGELSITTLPNEVYSLTGLKLRARSPAKLHFNIELANGAEGYIPPPEQHTLGGYTTWPARTAGLEVQAETKIVDALTSALEEVMGEKCVTTPDDHGPYAQAVLASSPIAYWRMNDAEGSLARNAVKTGPNGKLTGGYAFYLPGVGSGSGIGSNERLTASPFSHAPAINRSIHFASGSMAAQTDGLGDDYTLMVWVWLGERSGASQRSGLIAACPGGERLIAHQDSEHRMKLELTAGTTIESNTTETSLEQGGKTGNVLSPSSWSAEDWTCVVLVRSGAEVRIHVNGEAEPVLQAKLATTTTVNPQLSELRFADELQGKLDEIAIFPRALSVAEISKLWKLSGIAPSPTAKSP